MWGAVDWGPGLVLCLPRSSPLSNGTSVIMASDVRLEHFLPGLDFVFCTLRLVTPLCPTLCDPGTVAHQALLPLGILQARILEGVAVPSSRGSS